ncbi:hypothetical protein AF72_08885 [Xylella taiwanensis]|uniref:Uncharacterized protein n=1 Tax=Xylella taiwanensis TaxID=1444770 RepID=Z9JHX2_9GAMM|nr:hypothetical protein AB672_06730 [Xylella taiwanensis]EWS77789.1 hypothetical protein AF72_08885 [Xylella taiwanensis]
MILAEPSTTTISQDSWLSAHSAGRALRMHTRSARAMTIDNSNVIVEGSRNTLSKLPFRT